MMNDQWHQFPHQSRKSVRCVVHRLALVLPAALAGLTNAYDSADGALDSSFSRLVNHIIQGDRCASEYREARRVHHFDLNGDGKKDAIVLFTIEGRSCGNTYSFRLAAFRKVGKTYRLIDHTPVGGKWYRHVDFDKVSYKDGRITLNTWEYKKGPDPDPSCCPSLKREAVYVIRDGKLVTEKGRKP
jgi:hypothetical protein